MTPFSLTHLPPTLNSVVSLSVAFILGMMIGLERQYRQRTAGLRTNVLVAIGAAAFADTGLQLLGPEGATRIISYVISGIGFLGAGVIMKEGTNVRGLNTAATLWATAAVGSFVGAGLPVEGAVLTVFVLAGNTLLRPLVNYINRQPIDHSVTESCYRLYVVTHAENIMAVRELLSAELALAHYPIREIETTEKSDEKVELAAVLVPTTAIPEELDAVVRALSLSDMVDSAAWTAAATH